MKILIIGGTGTIGKKVSACFARKHEVLLAGRSSAELPVDISNSRSIEALFAKIGYCHAIVCVAGEAKWADFETMSEADFYIGIQNKLMGQVNLVR
ncbi:MAG: NAD-dependent epimerase/dehydratase family protein, partial [Candidatus Sericytochromatia bacterium]